MSCGGITGLVSNRLIAYGTDTIFVPNTGWMPSLGMEKIKAILMRAGNAVVGTGQHQFKLAVQVALVRTDKPEPWGAVGTTWYNDGGESCTTEIDISADTDGALFVRFGVAHKLSLGTASLGQTDVELQVSYESCGGIIDGTTLALMADTTEDRFAPVGRWIPAMTVDRVMAAIVATSESGDFQCRLAYRTATTSQNEPGAWSTAFDAWHVGSGEWNTTLLTPTLANDMWIQFGIQYALTTGTSLGQATVSVATAVRKV